MDLALLLAPWAISGPVTFRKIETGFINSIFAVEAPSGKYVLRIYREPGDLSRIHHEHLVSAWLQGAQLSFTVPVPVAAADGRTLVSVADPDGEVQMALLPFLSGGHPDFRDLPQAEAAGCALGELVAALGGLESAAWLPGVPAYGDLHRVHAEIPDPLSAVASLPVEPDWRRRIQRAVESALLQAPELYRRLPQQIIHGDFTPGNVLMDGNRIVGVLDFEFSAQDLRAMDYTVGLGGGPKSLYSGWADWTVLEAFSKGYFSRHSLSDEELEALPQLIRLRRVNILIKFAGRFRRCVDPEDVVIDMAWWTLHAEDWLQANGNQLIREAKRWARQAR